MKSLIQARSELASRPIISSVTASCIIISPQRSFSTAFLDGYLAHVGARICDIAGGYEIEGPGVQLFERVEGDYFTIVGLPLLPLLQELRARGRLPS